VELAVHYPQMKILVSVHVHTLQIIYMKFKATALYLVYPLWLASSKCTTKGRVPSSQQIKSFKGTHVIFVYEHPLWSTGTLAIGITGTWQLEFNTT